MSKKEKRVTLIRFDPRRIRRLRPLARLVSGLLPWCGPLSLLAGCTAMALARLSLAAAAAPGCRRAASAGAAGAGALGWLPCDTVHRVVCRISGSGTVSVLSAV